MRHFMLCAALLAALSLLAGCTVEQGGTEDPKDFSQVEGLEQPNLDAETVQSPDLTEDAAAVLPEASSQVDTLKTEVATLTERLNTLEARLEKQARRIDQLTGRTQEPKMQGDAEGQTPLIDLGDDKAFEEQVVREGLEQIVNMSRLLLDKMEYEMNQELGGALQETPAAESPDQGTMDRPAENQQ
ncbi:hypothetical protein SAMN02745704_01892 [Paucidesulfovibrio gracilis DSM 16080]|uniref:Uncharacterized protein n=1 Tax=Paucidesulfovibrio gracilis DSM 16080 TaxID=1121449 RepID=A0A1T4X7N7_9BACT|nr:hypothetical protein [Paucidesulfovibrio gracilis]SKA85566.1 hypothetical protein SAMN02745704_01892 [Paucidesulfovibrio gracilis DSM 16080]